MNSDGVGQSDNALKLADVIEKAAGGNSTHIETLRLYVSNQWATGTTHSNFLKLLLRDLRWDRPNIRDLWVSTIYPLIDSEITHQRMDDEALRQVISHCEPLIHERTRMLMEELLSKDLVSFASRIHQRAIAALKHRT